MNIVWLTPEIPYPPYGGRNGVFNRIVQLSKYHNIYLFSIAYSEEEKNMTGKMEHYCKEVRYYNRSDSKAKTLFKSIVLPYTVASRSLHNIMLDIEELNRRIAIDSVIIDFPNMYLNAKKIAKSNVFITVNQHNIEYKRMREMANIQTISFFKRLAYYIESFRLELYEAWLYRSRIIDSITFFSEDDLQFFGNRWKNCSSDLKVFPLGANCMNSVPAPEKHYILFVGRLDEVAVTNVEAVMWFCDNVLPYIKEKISDVKFIIAGANPSKRIMDRISENIMVIPNYQNLQEVYAQADCVVLPLLSGGGVKGKLLEAAALRRIIITTSKGIEGTKFQNGKHVFLADNPLEFANACIRALEDSSACADMIEASYDLFETCYSWETIGREYSLYLTEKVQIHNVDVNKNGG